MSSVISLPQRNVELPIDCLVSRLVGFEIWMKVELLALEAKPNTRQGMHFEL